MRFKVNVSPFEAGLVLGLGAAVVQGFYRVIPPEAYGVCFAGHSRDLVNWIANNGLGTNWFVEAPSLAIPVLTVVGVVAGSWMAALQHEELSPKTPVMRLKPFPHGFITVNLALIVGACPTRTVLLSAYGDPYGIALLVCIALGVVVGSHLMRRNARRAVAKRSAS